MFLFLFVTVLYPFCFRSYPACDSVSKVFVRSAYGGRDSEGDPWLSFCSPLRGVCQSDREPGQRRLLCAGR